jgi:hypothetical protein
MVGENRSYQKIFKPNFSLSCYAHAGVFVSFGPLCWSSYDLIPGVGKL